MFNGNIEQQKQIYQARRNSYRPPSWLELGKENGLWQTKEDLNAFRIALTVYARSIGRGEGWIVTVLNSIALNGMSLYWDEWSNGLTIGTIDKREWEIAPGKINPSFKSYLEQMKFGDAGNSTAKAAELAAQALLNPLKAASLWQEYQRRLERELAEKAKCDRLGISYLAPSELIPKLEITHDRTMETQSLLQIDRPRQISGAIETNAIAPAEYPPLPEDLKLKLESVMGRIGEPEVVEIAPIQPEYTPIIPVQIAPPVQPLDVDDIVREVFSNNNLYRYNPDKAKAWAEANRDRLSQWLDILPERIRDRHLEKNKWLVRR
jgi:hypothetical protein